MNKNFLILGGLIIILAIVISGNSNSFQFWQQGQTINVEYGSNLEIFNKLINDRPEPVYYQIDVYKNGKHFSGTGPYYSIEANNEVEVQVVDYYLDRDSVYDIKYVMRSQFDQDQRVLETGTIRYTVNVNSAPNSQNDIPLPYIPPVGPIQQEIDIPEPVYDSTIQAVISYSPPSPLSSGVYEVLVDDLSTGKITYWRLYQDDKLLYEGSQSFKSFRAYIEPGDKSIFMIEVSNSGRVSTAYAVADTGVVPIPPLIQDYGMVASIVSENLKPFANNEYSVDIVDKSYGNIDQYILFQDGYEIYRGSSSFGTRNQIIPMGGPTIFMIELHNEKAIATAYTVVDTTEVDLPSLYFGSANSYTNMIVLLGIGLFVIWAFMGFKKPF